MNIFGQISKLFNSDNKKIVIDSYFTLILNRILGYMEMVNLKDKRNKQV
jgi:hypothetical protein